MPTKTPRKPPTFEVRARHIDELTPYARNARTHSDQQVEEIARSIEVFGWTNPILADAEGNIVAGHGRRMAALRIYDRGGVITFPGKGGQPLPAGTVPVIDCTGWTEDQRRAYVLADNQLALNAEWDMEILGAELRDLNISDVDLSVLGFDEDQLSAAMNPGNEGAGGDPDDEAPEPPADPVSRLGDTWILGGHRLRCGDSTNAEDVAALLDGAEPHLMVTDPPYGVEYDAQWRNEAGRSVEGQTVRLKSGKATKPLGARAVGKVMNDDRADWREAWALFPGDVAYVWHAGLHAGTVADSLASEGFELRSQIIWAKNNMVIGRGNYHWKHEPCWYAVRKGATARWAVGHDQTTLWEIDKPRKSETGHSTQKPVECMRRPIINNSKPGDLIYEPFCGSGTTLIAAEMEGRRAFCMELSPSYVDVIVKRWQAFTGETATLEDGGRSFEAVAAERLPVAA